MLQFKTNAAFNVGKIKLNDITMLDMIFISVPMVEKKNLRA
jgi:hypothetical protein